MSLGLRILPAADADVDAQAAYIAEYSVEQALRFYDAVQATYQLILEAPERWALHGFNSERLANLRKRSVLGFRNHFIFYRLDANMVEIVRFLHGARDFLGLFGDGP